MIQPTDEALVLSAKSGDKVAFGHLVDRYQNMAMNIALRMVGDESSAQDLAQEAMLQAYLSLSSLRDPSRFKSWLYGVVRNVCGTYLRQQKVFNATHHLHLLSNGHAIGPEEIIQQRELDAFIMEQINRLSVQNRSVILLFYYGRLSLREIATQLGVSVSAVKNRLYKSRKQLKAQLMSLEARQAESMLIPLEQVALGHRVVHTSLSKQGSGRNDDRRQQVQKNLAKRRHTVVKITSVQIVQTEETENYIVFLLDQADRRALPIWVDSAEGMEIMLMLRQVPVTRPKGYSLMNQILSTLGATVQEVQLQTFTDDTFYALIRVDDGNNIHELESRASDAIALALHTQSPIVIEEEVMAMAAATLPESFDESAWQQKESYPLAELEKIYGMMERWNKNKGNLDRFTKRARSALDKARTEATRLKQTQIGTEHLLLGMALDEEGVGAKVLRELGIEKEQVVAAVEGTARETVADEDATVSVSDWCQPTLAPRLMKVIDFAAEERRILGHRYTGSEHLLLGIVREDRSEAANILRDLGLNQGQVRSKVLDKIIKGRVKTTS